MNENIKSNAMELDEELESEVDELLKLYLSSPILLETEVFHESESFKSGIDKALGICGIYSAFISNGISTTDALELIYNMLGAETSIKIAEIQKDAAVNAPPQQFGIM